MEMRLLNGAPVCCGLGFGQNGVDGAHVGLHAIAYRKAVDGCQHFADVVVVAFRHPSGLGFCLKLFECAIGQLQQRIVKKLRARGVFRYVPTQCFHGAFLSFVPAAHRCDHMGLKARAKPVVDVHHRHARRARVQHGQKRRQPVKAGAVTHRCWHGNDRAFCHAAHHAGKRALHAGNGNNRRSARNVVGMGKQPVDAGNPHVVQAHHARPEHLGRNGGFLRTVQVAGSRTRHGNVALARWFRDAAIQAKLRQFAIFEHGRVDARVIRRRNKLRNLCRLLRV